MTDYNHMLGCPARDDQGGVCTCGAGAARAAWHAATGRTTDASESIVVCERCQAHVPDRLASYIAGVRGAMAWRCACCHPQDHLPTQYQRDQNRLEVIALRKANRE